MAKHGKKYRAAAGKVEQRPYQLDEAFGLLKQIAYAKFNETVELFDKATNPLQSRTPVAGGFGRKVKRASHRRWKREAHMPRLTQVPRDVSYMALLETGAA